MGPFSSTSSQIPPGPLQTRTTLLGIAFRNCRLPQVPGEIVEGAWILVVHEEECVETGWRSRLPAQSYISVEQPLQDDREAFLENEVRGFVCGGNTKLTPSSLMLTQ